MFYMANILYIHRYLYKSKSQHIRVKRTEQACFSAECYVLQILCNAYLFEILCWILHSFTELDDFIPFSLCVIAGRWSHKSICWQIPEIWKKCICTEVCSTFNMKSPRSNVCSTSVNYKLLKDRYLYNLIAFFKSNLFHFSFSNSAIVFDKIICLLIEWNFEWRATWQACQR